MSLDDQHDVRLSTEDVLTLCVGLGAYLREFASHRVEDDDMAHPEAEWQSLRMQVGRLIWRLEEVTKPAGASIVHSEYAVPPDDDDDATVSRFTGMVGVGVCIGLGYSVVDDNLGIPRQHGEVVTYTAMSLAYSRLGNVPKDWLHGPGWFSIHAGYYLGRCGTNSIPALLKAASAG